MSATSSPGSGETRTFDRDLPSPLACFVEATAKLAAGALERGDLIEAKLLLGQALHAVDVAQGRQVAGTGLRVVGGAS